MYLSELSHKMYCLSKYVNNESEAKSLGLINFRKGMLFGAGKKKKKRETFVTYNNTQRSTAAPLS